IHNNPVEAGIVEKAEDYLYSSARDYFEGKNIGLLEIEFGMMSGKGVESVITVTPFADK
ncbi:MAG: hypothetical protein HYZ44_13790, partial [Bacteroidetes bacterium]|nr:hypothetical protein [Bacteroidota bacterium]